MRVPTLLLILLTAFAATDIYAATLTVTKTADTNDNVCGTGQNLVAVSGASLPTLSGTKAIECLKQNSQYVSLMEAFAATRKGEADETPTEDAFQQTTQLIATDGAAGDNFGVRVAISGETAVVGAYFDDVGANANQGSARN